MASKQDDAEDTPRVVVKRYRKRTYSEAQHPPNETSHTPAPPPAPLLRSTPKGPPTAPGRKAPVFAVRPYPLPDPLFAQTLSTDH